MALADSFVKQEFLPDMLEQERLHAYLEEAGLEGRETEKLRKTLLSPAEAVQAKTEQLTAVRQRKGRKTDWEEFTDVKRRMGRTLHHSEIVRRLRGVMPSLLVAPGGQRGRVGLYVIRNVPADEIEGCLPWMTRYVECPFYVSFLELGYSPEYEIDVVNDAGVAIAQRRGWRTLLLRLIARRDPAGRPQSIITEAQAEAAFGPLPSGPTSSNYRRQLWNFRNGL